MKKIITAILSLNYLCAPKPSTAKKSSPQSIKKFLKKGERASFLKREIQLLTKQLKETKNSETQNILIETISVLNKQLINR